MKRGLKFLLYFFLGLVGLIALLLMTSQTRFFKNWLRDFAVTAANESLNGELSIGRIDGNFFTNLEVTDILVKGERDTVVFLPRFRVELSPLSIFQSEIRVDAILLEELYLKFVQLPDSTWNVNQLVKIDSTAPPPPASTQSPEPFGYQLSLLDFYLQDASIRISSPDSLLPKSITNFNIRLAGVYSDQAQALHLKQFGLRTQRPGFDLRELTFSVSRNEQETVLENFVLRTARNRLDANGTYFAAADLNSGGRIESEPIDFGEFRMVVPALNLAGNPTLSIDTAYENDRLEMVLEITEQDQRILLQGAVDNVSSAVEDPSSAEVKYSLHGTLNNVDVAHWLNDSTMAHLLNAEFELGGQGLSPENARANLAASFQKSVFFGRPVENMSFAGDYNRGDLAASLDVLGNFGRIVLDANVVGVADTQSYNLTLELSQMNAAKLMMDDSLQTDVNLMITARGHSFDPQTASGQLEVSLARSAVLATTIDTLWSTLRFTADDFEVDTLHFGSSFLQLDAGGLLSLVGENDLRFSARVGDLMALNHFIQADTIYAAGEIQGHVSGTLDSLFAVASLGFENVVFNANSLDSLAGEIFFYQNQSGHSGKAEIRIRNAGTPDLTIDLVDIRYSFTDEIIDVVLDVVHQEDIRANLHTRILLDSIPRVLIPDMAFAFKGQHWSGGSGETEIVLQPESYLIRSFRLASQSESSSEQLISIDGAFSLAGEEDLRVEISGIDLGALATLLQTSVEVDGRFFLNLQIEGTADRPIITGSTAISEGKLGELAYETLRGWIDYRAERLEWHFGFLTNPADSLSVDGYLPLNLALTNTGEVVDSTQPLELRIKSDGLPLEVIRAGSIAVDNVSGRIMCDIKVTNTIDDPRPSGFLSLEDGTFALPDYGVDYTDFLMRLSLDSASVSLDTLQARRDGGKITATGFLAFDSSLVSGAIKSTEFHLLADKFYLARHRDYEIQISADAEFSGDTEAPRFGGGITILRSSFFLPAFMEKSAAPAIPDDGSVPMLVAATRDFPSPRDSKNIETTMSRTQPGQNSLDLYKNLRGTFKISIPKNTWLKSPDMRLEIAGDLDLVKNGPDFEIFGPIRVVRGYYDLRGRRFIFLEGLLTFQGGAEYNPVLALQLEYVFRTAAREKKSLKLFVSGKALTPELKFTLDDADITEGDAVSLIMFGRSLDELTGGQKSSLAGSNGDSGGNLAQGLAADLVAQQLTKTLGNKLNLDFIEIKSQDNWQNATFVVGKYLTNDLFMSYERGFGESEDDEIQPAVITLEYELTRFLFLQLIDGTNKNSGYDVIFKFER